MVKARATLLRLGSGEEASSGVQITAARENLSLTIMLRNEHWFELKNFFRFKPSLSKEEAILRLQRTGMTGDPLVPGDEMDVRLMQMQPGMRAGWMKFYESGVLNPYSASREGFDVPNP
jgi:hypothetical protein